MATGGHRGRNLNDTIG